MRLNKRLSKQSRRRWFETSSGSLRRHCNVDFHYIPMLDDISWDIRALWKLEFTMMWSRYGWTRGNLPIFWCHYCDVIMSPTASQFTSLTIVYSIVRSGTDQRKYQSSASLAFVRGIHRRQVTSPHKWPVTRKIFPFGDVIMRIQHATSGPSGACATLQIRRHRNVNFSIFPATPYYGSFFIDI